MKKAFIVCKAQKLLYELCQGTLEQVWGFLATTNRVTHRGRLVLPCQLSRMEEDKSCSGAVQLQVGQGRTDTILYQQNLENNIKVAGSYIRMTIQNTHQSQQQKIKVWKRPSQSPDLNNIKNLWMDLKKAVYSRQLRNISELEIISRKNWRSLGRLQKASGSCYFS